MLRDIVREPDSTQRNTFSKITLPEYKEKLKANTDELIERGGFGSPTMFVDGDMYFGNDRLAAGRARAHPSALGRSCAI